MKVLHITAVRKLSPGQRKQLEHEVLAAEDADLDWDTVALHTHKAQTPLEMRIPKFFRSRILVRLYGWLYAIRHSPDYDLILMRDFALDIFGPALGCLVRNRVTLHHAKEIEELRLVSGSKLTRLLAVLIEKRMKPLTMRSALGLAAVTEEIKEYQVERFPRLRKFAITIPNGYHYKSTQPVKDNRNERTLTFIFVCGKFSAWQGLDRLLAALQVHRDKTDRHVTIHLVGRLSKSQVEEIKSKNFIGVEVLLHGVLDSKNVELLLSESDIAISTLAIDRKNLREASTLKVREYLAAGVPVYALHADTALPASFPFYYKDTNVSLNRMVNFAEKMTKVTRGEVREASRPFLDKEQVLRRAITHLSELRR